MLLNGETQLYPILGDPIAQVRSPQFLTALLHHRGINAQVPPFQVSSKDFANVIHALKQVQNVKGFVITIPHKIPSLDVCDHVSERAQFIGSVNIIHKTEDGLLKGDNVDGLGYLDGIEKEGFSVLNKRALLIGAGGAGSAVAFEILKRGATHLSVYDVDAQRLERLINALNVHFPGQASLGSTNPEGYDLIANVTPVGMRPNDPYPVEVEKFLSRQFVADAITKPEVSPMIEYARSLGCNTMVGAGMFNAEAEILVDFMVTGGVTELKE